MFSKEEKKILSFYITDLNENVFALTNLPEVVKGALFSRYSRSTLSLKLLLLKEFLNENFLENNLSTELNYSDSQQKAHEFYKRVLDNFGDDSIGELGGAHVAFENVSILTAKILEEPRIGGSPLEKSTRYVYFNEKVLGKFRYYREPNLISSIHRNLYVNTCDMLFETYSKLIPDVTIYLQSLYPKHSSVSEVAYKASLRAYVLDCLRGLLPSSTLTNVGIFGNGRFWQNLIQKLGSSIFFEPRTLGDKCYEALKKVIPSFISRVDPSHQNFKDAFSYHNSLTTKLQFFSSNFNENIKKSISKSEEAPVKLVYFDPIALYKVIASMLYPYSNKSFDELLKHSQTLTQEEIETMFLSLSENRTNRRNKSPRGLECAEFCFDIKADFGVYRDLQRHRLLTQERQRLTCNYDYFVPEEIKNSNFNKIYCETLDKAREAFFIIEKDFINESQYVVPMAFNVRWFFHINLRSLQWLCELRSQPQGHSGYRLIAQKMAKEVIKVFPLFKYFLNFVNYTPIYLGRQEQENKIEAILEN